MTHVEQQVEIGDVVRVRETLVLFPLYADAPAEVPAGIYGEVVDYFETGGDLYYRVEFHEPYEYVNEIPLRADLIEIMFRFSLN